jgi:hypothetical protein
MQNKLKDYGADPMGNGMFKMVPSGDIVNREERNRRMEPHNRREIANDCLGLSWNQIETMQGGKLTL